MRGYNNMATCDYSLFARGPCGCSNSNPANVTCVAIAQCGKDIKSRLKVYDCFDSTLKTETDLLTRAAPVSHNKNHLASLLLIRFSVSGGGII